MFDLPPKAKKILKKLPLILLVLAVAGLILWFMAIRPALSYFEKKRFEAAYTELEKLSQEIQAKIGPADAVSSDNSCGRANLKNSAGPLLCNVGVNHEYKNISPEIATNYMNMLASMFDGEVREGIYFGIDSKPSDPNIFVARENGRTGQIFDQSIESYGDLRCAASYKHEIKDATPVFYVNYSCYKSALTEHYGLRN